MMMRTFTLMCLTISLNVWRYSRELAIAIMFLVGLGVSVNTAHGKQSVPNPNELIGKIIIESKYPDGWQWQPEGGTSSFDKKYSYERVKKKKINALIFKLRLNATASSKQPNTVTWQVIAAVPLKGDPKGNTWYEVGPFCRSSSFFGPYCRGANIPMEQNTQYKNEVCIVEIVFNKCARYTDKILNSWILNLGDSTLMPFSPQGMECANDYLDSGLFEKCKFTPRRW